MCEHYLIDQNKVYASGQSSGGMMSWACARDLGDIFVAVAPISANGTLTAVPVPDEDDPKVAIIGFIGARYIGTDNPMSDRQGIIAWLGILILCIGVPKIIFMLIDLVGRLLHAIYKPISIRFFGWLGLILGIGFFCIAFYGSFFGVAHFQVKEITYTSPRLPEAFDGYRIVQISDIHSGSYKQRPGIVKTMMC